MECIIIWGNIFFLLLWKNWYLDLKVVTELTLMRGYFLKKLIRIVFVHVLKFPKGDFLGLAIRLLRGLEVKLVIKLYKLVMPFKSVSFDHLKIFPQG